MKSSSKKQGSGSRSRSRGPSSSSESRQHQQSGSSGGQQQAASGAGGKYGEGNYEATRQYNSGLKRHLQSADVEQEARDAAPKTAAEQQDLEEAERVGRSRAKGEGVESIDKDVEGDENLEK